MNGRNWKLRAVMAPEPCWRFLVHFDGETEPRTLIFRKRLFESRIRFLNRVARQLDRISNA